jgi:hypothetical protein
MTCDTTKDLVEPDDLADILENMASLMASFHKSDLAVQDALSAITTSAMTGPNMFELQHVDLITQSHQDLSELLAVLAACARGRRMRRSDLAEALTLHSLKDTLLSPHHSREEVKAGELSLF